MNSEKLLAFLETKNIGKLQLAELLGLSRQSMYNYLKPEKLKLNFLQKVAEATKIDISEIIKLDQPKVYQIATNEKMIVNEPDSCYKDGNLKDKYIQSLERNAELMEENRKLISLAIKSNKVEELKKQLR